jgi:hypothetical protein
MQLKEQTLAFDGFDGRKFEQRDWIDELKCLVQIRNN